MRVIPAMLNAEINTRHFQRKGFHVFFFGESKYYNIDVERYWRNEKFQFILWQERQNRESTNKFKLNFYLPEKKIRYKFEM